MQDSDHLRASRLSTLRSKLATRDEPSLLRAAHKAGQLQFFGQRTADPPGPRAVRRRQWR